MQAVVGRNASRVVGAGLPPGPSSRANRASTRPLPPRQKDRACSLLRVCFVSFAAFPSTLVVRPASRETAQLRRSHATHCPKLRTNELSLSRPLSAIAAGNMIGVRGVFPEGGIVGFSWSCSPEIPCRLFRMFRVLFFFLSFSAFLDCGPRFRSTPRHSPPTDPNSRIEATGSGRVARARSTPVGQQSGTVPHSRLARWVAGVGCWECDGLLATPGNGIREVGAVRGLVRLAAPSPARCWLSQMLIACVEPSLRGHRAPPSWCGPSWFAACESGGDSV